MSESELCNQQTTDPLRTSQLAEQSNLRHVLACVDTAPCADIVLAHAAAVAKAVGACMTVIHVLQSSPAQEPMDPVEWKQRHCAATAYLHERMLRCADLHADVVILAGPPRRAYQYMGAR